MVRLARIPRIVKILILLGIDAGLAVAAYWIAAVSRVGRVPDIAPQQVFLGSVLVALLMPAIALSLGYYRQVTRYYSPNLVQRTAVVGALCAAVLAAIAAAGGARPMQAVGFALVFGLVYSAFLLGSRAFARWILRDPQTQHTLVAIYGAGEAGRQLAAMLRRSAVQRPVAFVDDDTNLRDRLVEGLPVVHRASRRFQSRLDALGVREILLAVPSLTASRRREVLEFLSGFHYRVRSVPRLADIASGARRGIDDLQEIAVEDLLGRDAVHPLPGLLDACIRDRAVLVTGAGGSIGSELCRQVMALGPKKLIALDHCEYALYSIEQELAAAAARTGTAAALEFVLASVTDRNRIIQLFAEHTIDTVYHAAAYKHVPIVERNPVAGFRGNTLGTWHMARAAAEAGVSNFVLISTDKAVRPANVMGATKRIAELAVAAVASRSPGTKFAMVRFGNVLASSGSVVPLFTRQIAEGGPVTVTHSEVSRYFMTLREAVELVIQAGAMARGCELFVLDMGTPVRIRDLAERMVRLSGRTVRDERNPGGDIAIEVTGLRPGEKLHEELLIDGDATGTVHPRILQMREVATNVTALEAEMGRLEADGHDDAACERIRTLFGKWVAGYAVRGSQAERENRGQTPISIAARK